MPNIRIRRFPSAPSEEWEMDCFVLPNDEINGELVHYNLKKVLDFRKIMEPGLFVALDGLLDCAQLEAKSKNVKMVLGRLKDEKKTYYYLKALAEYLPNSPEAKIWTLINSIFKKRLEE
jgi:hypothetical protein